MEQMWKGKTQISTLYHTFVSKVLICQSLGGKFIASFYSRLRTVTEAQSGWGWKGPPEPVLGEPPRFLSAMAPTVAVGYKSTSPDVKSTAETVVS